MAETGSPIYNVARALYDLMPERWAGGLAPSEVPWHSASEETKARLFEAAKAAIWTLRPVGNRMREAGEKVSSDAGMVWTVMIDAALDTSVDPPS